MKKQILKSALIAMAGVGLLAGSAMASPTTADYWTSTQMDSDFQSYAIENNTNLVNFSLVFVDDINNPDPTLIKEIQLFGNSGSIYGSNYLFENEAFSDVQVSFQSNGDITVQYDYTAIGDSDPYSKTFYGYGTIFGFRINQFYTDSSLNAGYVDPISIYYNPDNATIETMVLNSTNQSISISVKAADVAPVPEPGTMLLLGTGLAGLAAVGRRRKTQA